MDVPLWETPINLGKKTKLQHLPEIPPAWEKLSTGV